MTRTLACSATFAASVLWLLSGCGGGGSTQTAPTPTTLAPAAAPARGDDVAPLLVWAEAEPEEGDAPLTVQFKGDGDNVEGGKPPLKYTWKFGDGSADSSEVSPKHVYEKPGKYRVDLAVDDAGGDSDADYVEITVNQPAAK
jgi:PKD repeat protein